MRNEKALSYYLKIYNSYQKLTSDSSFYNEEEMQEFIEKRINKAKLKESSMLAG